jgi:hypothetical protein
MKTKLFALILIVALVGGYQATGAAPRPSIITFDSSLRSITVDDAEAESVTTTLTWHTAGLTDEYRLRLHAYLLDRWEPVFPPDSVPLVADGARVVTVRHPLNFGPPTFLLSILHSATNNIVDQRILTIPYDLSSVSDGPVIDMFQADAESLDAAALQDKSAQVLVSWSVSNRVPTSNLVIEQVLMDGSAVSVELPRLNLWIPSVAQGPVAPIYEADADAVTLRLQVLDVVTGSVLAEKTLAIEIAGAEAEGPEMSGEADTEELPAPAPETAPPSTSIVSFTATPDTVNPDAAITLTWEVLGTGGVTIEQSVPNTARVSTVVNAMSPKGSAEVYLPEYAAYSVTYTLKTADGKSSAQTRVLVHCPYTFFFGRADGCPTGAAFTVGASYQPFENGYMIWRSDNNDIYVHYDGGTAGYFTEKDYAGLPDAVLDEMPPLDREAPGSGFGKVWINAPGVRENLGWALESEAGYTAKIQGVALTRDPRPSFAFYLTLPDGSIVGSGLGIWRSVP